MEICEKYVKLGSKYNDYKNNLYENLKVIHTCKMVHLDIKTDNVRWSPYFNKWVFIDFGFTKFIKEQVGLKSTTGFVGTVGWGI